MILTKNLDNIFNGKTPDFTHPKFKWNTDDFQQNSVSLNLNLMYGQKIYQEYFGNFLYALTGSSEIIMPMRFHRKVWIPLYYPESFLSKIKKSSIEISPLQFFKFKKHSVALAIEKLILTISKNIKFRLKNGKKRLY